MAQVRKEEDVLRAPTHKDIKVARDSLPRKLQIVKRAIQDGFSESKIRSYNIVDTSNDAVIYYVLESWTHACQLSILDPKAETEESALVMRLELCPVLETAEAVKPGALTQHGPNPFASVPTVFGARQGSASSRAPVILVYMRMAEADQLKEELSGTGTLDVSLSSDIEEYSFLETRVFTSDSYIVEHGMEPMGDVSKDETVTEKFSTMKRIGYLEFLSNDVMLMNLLADEEANIKFDQSYQSMYTSPTHQTGVHTNSGASANHPTNAGSACLAVNPNRFFNQFYVGARFTFFSLLGTKGEFAGFREPRIEDLISRRTIFIGYYSSVLFNATRSLQCVDVRNLLGPEGNRPFHEHPSSLVLSWVKNSFVKCADTLPSPLLRLCFAMILVSAGDFEQQPMK